MRRLLPALLLAIGFLTVFLPHFGLPMDYYRTVTMAYDRPVPRWWTHLELYPGIVLFICGFACLVSGDNRRRIRLLALSAVTGLVIAAQGLLLEPASGWMYWEPEYVRAYHRAVLALHRGISPVLAGLGLSATLIASLGLAWHVRYPHGRRGRLGLGAVASSNIFRRPFRTAAVILNCALAAGITFFCSYVLIATLSSGRLQVSRFGADIIVVPEGYEPSTRDVLLGGEPVEFVMPGEVLEKVLSVRGVLAASPQLYIRALPYRGCCAVLDMLVVAIDPATDFTVSPWVDYTIKDGLGPGEVLLGYHVMFAPGQRIQIFDDYMHVVGMLQGTGLEFFDTSAFVSLEHAHAVASRFPGSSGEGIDIPPGSISSVLVRLVPGTDVDEAAGLIRAAAPGVDVIPVKSLLPPARLWLLSSVEQLWPLIALVWALSCSVLVVMFFMMFNERLREVGLLRALGARRRWVLGLFMAEAGFTVATGAAVGTAAGWVAAIAYRHALGAEAFGAAAVYDWPGGLEIVLLALGCIAAGLAAGLLSALFPAYRASGAEPYDAIRKGE